MSNLTGKNNPLLDRKGRPAAGPKVAMRSQAYQALINAARSGMPEETVGALVGRSYNQQRAQEWITVEEIAVLELVPAGLLGLTISKDAWEELKARLENTQAGAEALRIVGWFYADPGIGLFRPRVDVAEVQQALAADIAVFLLANPSTDLGVFYISRQGSLTPAGGFYELLPDAAAPPIIPWGGDVRGASEWLGNAVVAPGATQDVPEPETALMPQVAPAPGPSAAVQEAATKPPPPVAPAAIPAPAEPERSPQPTTLRAAQAAPAAAPPATPTTEVKQAAPAIPITPAPVVPVEPEQAAPAIVESPPVRVPAEGITAAAPAQPQVEAPAPQPAAPTAPAPPQPEPAQAAPERVPAQEPAPAEVVQPAAQVAEPAPPPAPVAAVNPAEPPAGRVARTEQRSPDPTLPVQVEAAPAIPPTAQVEAPAEPPPNIQGASGVSPAKMPDAAAQSAPPAQAPGPPPERQTTSAPPSQQTRQIPLVEVPPPTPHEETSPAPSVPQQETPAAPTPGPEQRPAAEVDWITEVRTDFARPDVTYYGPLDDQERVTPAGGSPDLADDYYMPPRAARGSQAAGVMPVHVRTTGQGAGTGVLEPTGNAQIVSGKRRRRLIWIPAALFVFWQVLGLGLCGLGMWQQRALLSSMAKPNTSPTPIVVPRPQGGNPSTYNTIIANFSLDAGAARHSSPEWRSPAGSMTPGHLAGDRQQAPAEASQWPVASVWDNPVVRRTAIGPR